MILERRVDTTRVDNEELIDELIQNTDFLIDDSAESMYLERHQFDTTLFKVM